MRNPRSHVNIPLYISSRSLFEASSSVETMRPSFLLLRPSVGSEAESCSLRAAGALRKHLFASRKGKLRA